MTARELTVYIIGVILFFAALFLGTKSDFYGCIKDPAVATLASLALSISVFLVADRLAASIRDSANHARTTTLVGGLASQIPRSAAITEFPTSNLAMLYLCQRIPDSRIVLNTKVSRDAVPPHRDVASEYELAVQRGLRRGLVYKDVISEGFRDYAVRLVRYASDKKGTYEYRVCESDVPCFLNFIVLELTTGEEELLIGWATSNAIGMEQRAYKIVDPRLIDYFKSYHGTLFG